MKEKISFCGYRCELCPAYKGNIRCEEDRQKVSDGWFKYYGFRIPAEQIYCDGCLAEDSSNPRRIDPECKVRACAIQRGLPNCAHCDDFICEKLSKKIIDTEKIAERARGPIPQKDFDRFVKPYDSAKILADIRKELGKLEWANVGVVINFLASISIVRVHNVAEMVDVARVVNAIEKS